MSDDRAWVPPQVAPRPETAAFPGFGGPASGQFLGTLQQILQALVGERSSITAISSILSNAASLQQTSQQTYAVTVGTSSTSAAPANATRTGLIFHNPGTVDVYIAQASDHLGTPITPTVGGPGTIQVMAGATFTFSSPGSKAWNSIAVSSAVLTVLESVPL